MSVQGQAGQLFLVLGFSGGIQKQSSSEVRGEPIKKTVVIQLKRKSQEENL